MSIEIVWDGFAPKGQKPQYRRFTTTILKQCLRLETLNMATIAVLYCDEERMRELNREFRGIDRSTDVLSFPFLSSPPKAGYHEHLGDLAICPVYCARGAIKQKTSYQEEIALMLVHGFLHLLGDDHDTAAKARAMNRRTRLILGSLEIPSLPELS